MTTPPKIRSTALACSLIMLCGLPASAAPTPKPTAPASQAQGASLEAMMSKARSALNLQPGDEALMMAAARSPLSFIAKESSREFTGQLIVHSKESRARIGERRVQPSMVKASRSVPEYVVDVPQGLSEGEFAAMLMATGDYEFVEPNWKLFPAVTPNDSQFGSSWQHTRLQSAAAWDLHTGTSDVIVAICDSGVKTNHPDLQAALVSGYNAASNQEQANGGSVEDVNGHGTFVSGCAAAQGNNGIGVVGVGWDFRIMPIRVSNNSDGTANGFDITEGARWAVDHGAKAINASFTGGTSGSNQSAAKYIIDRGGLFFWASGNDNTLVNYDGPDLVIVGSTTSSDSRSGFSNYGPAVDVSAPGSNVRSTNIGGGYSNGSGTSYASPIACGVGAMIFSVRDDISGQDAQDILYNSVDDLGAPGRDDSFGRGRVNTFKAVQMAMSYTPRQPLPVSESFDSASWMDLFSATSGSPATAVDAGSTGAGSVMVLADGDQITTVALGGGTLQPTPKLAFGLKTVSAELGEALSVEYSNADGSWTTLLNYEATGVDSDGYNQIIVQLPTEFRWHGVELRMTGEGSDASDQWMIDDLAIEVLQPTPTAPLVDRFESGPISSLVWDDDSGVGVAVSNQTHAAEFVGAQTLVSNEIPMNQFGIAPGYVRVDAWAGSGAGADDTVLLEVLDIASIWRPLGTLSGASLSTSSQTFEYETPILTWAIDTLRLRLTSAGNDPIYIDNVYVGPDQATSACSDADFNADGVLDFFDISEFLTLYGNGDLEADLNGDLMFDFFDISEFLTLYSAGCP